MEWWVFPGLIAVAILLKGLRKRQPHPLLKTLAPSLELAQIKGHKLQGRYQGRMVSVEFSERELELELACKTAVDFKAKTRRPSQKVYSNMPTVESGVAWLDEQVVFRSLEPDNLQRWLQREPGIEAFRELFAWQDVELKSKLRGGVLVLEWEHVPQADVTPERVRSLLDAMLALVPTLENFG